MTLQSFDQVGPELLRRRSLLRRTDTKFLLRRRDLDDVLAGLTANYGVLLAGGNRVARYETLYFDTGDRRCYDDHHRGRRARHKVRIRHYPDRRLNFLEVKTKTNRNLTDKARRRRRYGDSALTNEDLAFVGAHSSLSPAALEPRLWTNFERITLVGFATNERVTIDSGLEIIAGDGRCAIGELMIVEVKQAPFCRRTPVMTALRRVGARPTPASKYCLGVAMTEPVRTNRFAPVLRAIERMAS
jgi:hypothetical protein